MIREVFSLYLILFIFMLSNNSIAQNNRFLEGYAITIKGDTLYGKIKDFASKSRSCKYITMKDSNGINHRFTLNHIKYYKKGNEEYIMKSYDKEKVKFYHDKCFMKLIARGKINLYRFDYLLNEEKTPYTYGLFMSYSEPHFDYYIEKNGNLFRVLEEETLEHIAWLFTDNYSVFSKIMDYKTKSNELEKLVNEYNAFEKISGKN